MGWLIKDAYVKRGKEKKREYVASTEAKDTAICRQKSYDPHVTLGYFANEALPSRTMPPISHWSMVTEAVVRHLTVTFESISLYGFTDMATFFKV
jgi:2'-5' RNA ligase